MNDYLESLNLIDLISEKHKKLRRIVLEKYVEKEVLQLNEMSYYLISIINFRALTISESARTMGISRQAVHKFSKELVKIGLLEMKHSETNKRDKYLSLTEKGKMLYEEITQIKIEFEKEICDLIGNENIDFLKNLLKQKWVK